MGLKDEDKKIEKFLEELMGYGILSRNNSYSFLFLIEDDEDEDKNFEFGFMIVFRE